MEIPQPWPKEMFTQHPLLQELFPLLKKLILRRGVLLRPVAIASDPEYSRPGYTRLIYYRRPQAYFAQYEKQEYLVPEAEVNELAIALLTQLQGKTVDLSKFAAYLEPTEQVRDVMVCTHTQVDLACGRFGTPLYRQLRQDYGSESLRIWQSTHFGGHQFAPTLLDLPIGQFWGHLEPEIIEQIIHRQGDVGNLRPFYRGWSGLSKFEQIAEREIWMREGWQWLNQPRAGQVRRKGLSGIKQFVYPIARMIPIPLVRLWLEQWTKDVAWVEVQIQFQASEGEQQSTVRIEEKGTVMTALKSANLREVLIELTTARQYQVVSIT